MSTRRTSHISSTTQVQRTSVLQIVTEPLLERGYDVLRYNTRGTGKSKGWPSLTGSQEVEDLKELVGWVRSNTPNLAKLVILVRSRAIAE